MSRLKIEVNNGVLDLFDNTDKTFYISKQINDLSNLQDRQSDFTRQIKIPRTKNNAALLDLLSNERIGNESHSCNIYMDGILVIPSGTLLITSGNRVEVEIYIGAGNFELFDRIPDESINELDLSEYSFPWTIAGISAIKAETEGAVSVATMYNNIDDWLNNNIPTATGGTHDIRQYGFCVYLKTIFRKIIEEVGFSYDESLFASDDNYNDSVILCPVFADKLGELLFSNAYLSADFIYDDTYLSIPERIPFNTLAAGSEAWYSIPLSEFSIPSTGDYTIVLNYTIDYIRNTNESCQIDLVVGGTLVASNVYPSSQTVTDSITYTAEILTGVKIWALVRAGYQNGSKFDIVNVNTNSFLDVREAGDDPSASVPISDFLPEIKKRDFMIGFLSMFNAVLSSNPFTGEAGIISMNDIITDAEQDLTANVEASQYVTNEISLKGYYKHSEMSYKKDSNVISLEGEYIASFDKDASLPLSGSIISLPFGVSDNWFQLINPESFSFSFQSLQGFSINTGTNTYSFANDVSIMKGDYIRYKGPVYDRIDRVRQVLTDKTGFIYDNYLYTVSGVDVQIMRVTQAGHSPRIGLIDRINTINQSLSLNGYGTDNSFTGVTMDTLYFGPTMESIYNTYYKTLFDALQTPKIKTVWMNFNTVEFSQIDMLKPVYIQGFNGSYYINKINQFKLGSPCLVELIRINPLI